MSERMTATQIQAEELSSRMFDNLVDEALRGETVDVVVSRGHEDAGEYGFQEFPEVRIGRLSAFDYARRPMEYSATNTPELIEATAKAFEEKVGSRWESTVRFFKELEELDLALSGLAISRDAGYFDKAMDTLGEQGFEGVGDGEIVSYARQLATSELTKWVSAVENQPEQSATQLQTSDDQDQSELEGTMMGDTMMVSEAAFTELGAGIVNLVIETGRPAVIVREGRVAAVIAPTTARDLVGNALSTDPEGQKAMDASLKGVDASEVFEELRPLLDKMSRINISDHPEAPTDV